MAIGTYISIITLNVNGMTKRDGMGREVEGGFKMGSTCTPRQIHVDVWQNQYNIVK